MEQAMAGKTEGAINPDAMKRANEAFREELKGMGVAQSEVEKPKRFIVVLVDINVEAAEGESALKALEQFETTNPREAFGKMQSFFERTLAGEGRWVSVETIPDGQDSVINYGVGDSGQQSPGDQSAAALR